MSALFQSYEDEFAGLMKSAQRDMEALRNATKTGTTALSSERDAALKSVQLGLTKLKELWTNMDFESNDVLPGARTATKQKVAEYKKTMGELEREAAKAKSDCHRLEREELLRGSNNRTGAGTNGVVGVTSDGDPNAAAAKAKLANATEKVKENSKTLRQAERLVEETNDVGDAALKELGRQRGVLDSIRGKARDTDEELSQVRRVLTRMTTTMMKNKAMMVCIILVLLLMIFLIIYIRVTRGSSAAAPIPPPLPPPVPVGPVETLPPDSSTTTAPGLGRRRR